jgi:hypothetical protein
VSSQARKPAAMQQRYLPQSSKKFERLLIL